MFIKNKLVRLLAYVVLTAVAAYFGISFAAALHKAITQPYLFCDSEKFAFMGYYIIAAANGVIFAALTVLLTVLSIKLRRDGRRS